MKCKEAFTSPISAVIILHLCSTTHPDLLLSCDMWSQHKHECGLLIHCRCHPWFASKGWKICFISCVFHGSPEWIGPCELCVQVRLHMTGWAFCSAEPDENYSPHYLDLSWENTDNRVTGILSQVIGHLRVWEILRCNIILCKSQTVNNTSQAI